ncbi:MAG: hypothetical protein KC994_10680, partial [Candidatus Omnitrophica bacterium]|nr:hypothetical protein [Candidatus Omnitrophota bacterium]
MSNLKSNMPKTNSDSNWRRTLIFLSLTLPILALYLILKANLGDRGWVGSFPWLNWRFLTHISRYHLQFPEGFFIWAFWTLLGLLPSWILGWGILGRAGYPRLVRFWGAFPVGIGIVGVLFEWLAMAGALNRVSVLLVSMIAVGLGIFLSSKSHLQAERLVKEETAPRLVVYSVWTLFGILTWLNFQHAVFYPPNYWDALIYYLYYSKLIFLNSGIPFPMDSNGFPELVQCQVGLGLGANYAHLFLLWQASVCNLAGEWSTFPGQWIPPIAGLGTALLVYGTILSRTRNHRVALLSLLVVQSAPYWIWYQQWVSDYPLAVWFTVAAIALMGVRHDSPSSALLPMILVATAGSHLNYLMASLWIFPIFLWLSLSKPVIFSGKTIGLLIGGIVLSSTWFIRNWMVTGNPVYAFFPEIFGGINIDRDVLKSCQIEWALNGDGLRQVGSTVFKRIKNTPLYFLEDANTSMKLAALPLGWLIPGLLFYFGRGKQCLYRVSILAYLSLLFFYEYFISPLYLYHILPVVPMMVLIAAD